MENELLQVDVEAIELIQGSIVFNDYERIKEEAEALAEQIKTVEVSEENIKQSKKLLAVVNKRLKELEDARIGIKKTMLEPYQLFEAQVKEIVGIVKEADAEVRSQVRYLEEFERLEKEEAIKDLFFRRKQKYTLGELLNQNHFLKPSHLNKSTSLEKVEKEMVAFLEQTEKDVQVIQAMKNSGAILNKYVKIGGFNLAEALNEVNFEMERQKVIEASKAVQEAQYIKGFNIMIFGEKDFKLVEMFMKQNKISYEVL